jgi:hypothetical protein
MSDINLDDSVMAARYSEAIELYTALFGEHPPTIDAPMHWDSLEWLELVEDCVCDGVEMDHQQGNEYE